jgi:hypothetical protein
VNATAVDDEQELRLEHEVKLVAVTSVLAVFH